MYDPINHICFPKTDRFVNVICRFACRLEIVVQAGDTIHPERTVQQQVQPQPAISPSPLRGVDHNSQITPFPLRIIMIIHVSDKSTIPFPLQKSIETIRLLSDPGRLQLQPLRDSTPLLCSVYAQAHQSSTASPYRENAQ